MERYNRYLAKWNVLFDKKNSEWISFKPALGLQVYPCYSCRDMFSCKRSFLDHVNRRGMLIKYKCSSCPNKDALIFYNPCAFLLHTRQHYTLLSGQINLDHLEIGSLAVGLAGFLPLPHIPIIYDVQEDEVDCFINTRFYSPVTGTKGQQTVSLISNELLFFYSHAINGATLSLVLKQVSSNIPRCKFVTLDSNRFTPVPNGVDINGQRTENNSDVHIKDEITEPSEDCFDECNMPVVTKVEDISDTEEENFEDEADFEEEFPYCLECNEIQKNSMTEHFLKTNKPTDESIKCDVCKYIASTKCSLRAHVRIHDMESPFVCPECGKDFENWDLLRNHMDDVCFHLAKQVRLRCPGKKCGKIFAQVVTFTAHFSIHMQHLNKCSICNAAFFNEIEFAEHCKTHNDKKRPLKIYQCTVCPNESNTFDESDYKEHILSHANNCNQKIYVYICRHCRSYFRSTLTYATHLLRCSKIGLHTNPTINKKKETEQKNESGLHEILIICTCCKTKIKFQIWNMNDIPSVCPKCGKKFSDSLKKIKLIKNDMVNCILCRENLTREEIREHISLKKCKFNNPVVILESDLKDQDESERTEAPKSDEKKKRKRSSNGSNGKNKKMSPANSEPDLDPPEMPTPFDGVYHCKFCDYVNEDRGPFHSHIKIHRDISTAYQCMECGECFVVKPSLIKHMLYFHKVKDSETYFKENDCFDKTAVKELEQIMKLAPGESKDPVAENQCRVCLQQFCDAMELKKHFRVHGMAFLLRNLK